MRILFLILLFFFNNCSRGQVLMLGAISEPAPASPIGTFIEDNFNGSSLSADWDVHNPGLQSISVTGGELIIDGNDGTNLSPALKLSNIAWQGNGYSMLRNYYLEMKFRFITVGQGVFLGVNSRHAVASSSTYGCTDIGTGRLKIFGGNGIDQFDNLPANAVSTITMNNSSDYYMKLEVNEDACTLTLDNLTLGQHQVITFSYGFTPITYQLLRPNIFWYSFGVSGSTIAAFDYIKVSTNEFKNPKFLAFGNSITTGYFAGLAVNSWAYKLRTHTTDLLQIMAGGGLVTDDYLNALPEMLFINPQFFIFMIGTNDNGNFAAAFTKYQTIVNTVHAAGISTIHLPVINGGNPNTGGTYNNWIKTAYPTTFIDIWTTGWQTMSVGNGEMADGLHPTNTGMTKLANIIVAARPDLFPMWIIPIILMGAPVRRMRRKENDDLNKAA